MLSETSPQPSPEPIDMMSLLAHLSEVGDEQIADFRKTIDPNKAPIFDQFDKDEQKVLAALDSMTPDEMTELKKLAKKTGYLTGFHNLNEHLIKLAGLKERPN